MWQPIEGFKDICPAAGSGVLRRTLPWGKSQQAHNVY
jgi:hypothetical protein